MSDFRNSSILVTGASGHLGGIVVRELLARGATNVTAGSRDPSKLAVKGVRTLRVDLDDTASLDVAFAGIERLLLISTDTLGGANTRRDQHLRGVEAAKRAGVKHIVYTSMPAPEAGNPIPFAPDHAATEAAIKSSGMGYTILRHNWYFENLMMSLPQAIASGTHYTATGDGRLAQAARADYAAADAAALLTEAGSATYDLGGPSAVTTDELVATANRVLGTSVKVVHLDDAALLGGLKAAGVPEMFAGLIVSFDAAIRGDRMGKVTGDLERLTGRRAQSFEDWLARNRAAFAPGA
jgi:NAD(P)H dehydrogenase (quinone)